MTTTIVLKLSELRTSPKVGYWVEQDFSLGPFYGGLVIHSPTNHSWNYGTVNKKSLSYIEFKDSINLPLPASAKAQVELEFRRSSPNLVQRKPLRPKYNPPKFKAIEIPKYKLITTSVYKLTPAAISTEKSRKRFKRAVLRRDKLIRRLNEQSLTRYKRAVEQRMKILNLRRWRLEAYELTFKRRLVKYETRLANWQKSLQSYKNRIAKTIRRKVHYNNENAYHKATLVNKQSVDIYSVYIRKTDVSQLNPTLNWNGSYAVYEAIPIYFDNVEDADPSNKDKASVIVNHQKYLLRKAADTFDDVLIPRIYAKIESARVDVGNFIAERSQTIEMLSSAVKSIAQLLQAKKRFFASVARGVVDPKKLAGKYLEFKFGVQPLLSDYETLLEGLAASPSEETMKVRAVQKRIPIALTIEGSRISGLLEVRYVLRYRVVNEIFRELQKWGFVNPTSILWEVTPWSFVVDWFYPVGNIISALSADAGLEYVSGTRSISFTGTIESNIVDTGTFAIESAPVGVSSLVMGGSWSCKHKIREVLSSPPAFVLPAFKNPLSWTHGFLSLALLIQRVKK